MTENLKSMFLGKFESVRIYMNVSLFVFLVCLSKSPTGLMLHVVQYLTQNKISMSMSFPMYISAILHGICSLKDRKCTNELKV